MRILSLFLPRLGVQILRAARPELAGHPVGLLAGEGDGALLAAASVEATADGVEPGMTALQARQRCLGISFERDNARECLGRLEAVATLLRAPPRDTQCRDCVAKQRGCFPGGIGRALRR